MVKNIAGLFLSNKYNAIKVKIDGYLFDSKKEARRYQELKLLEKSRAIQDLELQPEFSIEINGQHICKYRADFRYKAEDKTVIEDAKGFKTVVYKLKKRMVEALYNIKIVEV